MSPAWLVQEISDHFALGYLTSVYKTMVSQSLSWCSLGTVLFRGSIPGMEHQFERYVAGRRKANLTFGIVNPKLLSTAYGSHGNWASGLVGSLEPEANVFSGTG